MSTRCPQLDTKVGIRREVHAPAAASKTYIINSGRRRCRRRHCCSRSWQLPTVLDACHAASVARSAKNSDTNGMNETSQIQSVYLLSVVDAP
jgi:hypothetical protein